MSDFVMEFSGGEEEIELSLGLAIGGSCKKPVRAEKQMGEAPASGESDMDLVKRREMQALRRQEARRKREEKKQMKRGVLRQRNCLTNQQVRNGGRAVVDGGNVGESDGDERALKREKTESGVQPQTAKSYAVDGADQSSPNACEFTRSEQPAPACASSASAYAFPIYAYPPLQYVPFANGFAYPCIAPVYRPESDATTKSAAAQTVSFRPFLGGNRNSDVNSLGGAAAVNARSDEGNGKAVSNGSVGCCSSAISENRSISSPQDGSSTDSGSHWSCAKSGKTEMNSSSGSDVAGSCKRKALSNPSATTNADKANNAPPASAMQPAPTKVSKQDTAVVEPKPANIPISRTASLPQPKTPATKDSKVDSIDPGKPPKPQAVENQETNSPLSQMPCVSTTGNGPDGKTITGFLYKYSTRAEVSIVCVCHGESFSPAEFVSHAGGVDITHPLRHITVVPPHFD
uniref:Ninja-family protein n=1 Tax=Kalanchoe fedtschenkoi TaxID=63787 RepID=A0A7N0TQ15_KALFE